MEMNGIAVLVVALVWFLNFGISWWNARVVGTVWVESKEMGGFTHFMTWMGAIMSASGFTWCYLIVLLLGGHTFYPEVLTNEAVKAGLSLGYLVIIPGVLFSGLMIWIESLVEAWRRRDLPSMGVAAWNSFAQIHNTYSAMEGIPDALKEVGNFFSEGDSDDAKFKLIVLVVILVVLALFAGILTTSAIIKKYAGSVPLPRAAYAH